MLLYKIKKHVWNFPPHTALWYSKLFQLSIQESFPNTYLHGPRGQKLFQQKIKNTRQESSMIHSARSTVSPAVNIVFAWNLLYFARFLNVGVDGQHVQKQLSLPAVTAGRPSGSKKGEKCYLHLLNDPPTLKIAKRDSFILHRQLQWKYSGKLKKLIYFIAKDYF